MRRMVILFFLIITSGSVVAQSVDCAATAQKAIEAARKVCADIERNQACYGNAKVEIKPRANVRLAFAKAGDVAPLASLEIISTSPFDADSKSWGLALLNIRADLLGGSLTALAFGQASIGNGSEASNDFVAVEITVTEPKGAILRSEPKGDAAVVRNIY